MKHVMVMGGTLRRGGMSAILPLAARTSLGYQQTAKDDPNSAGTAAMIGDHARAETLPARPAGPALTATELAPAAGVTKQTVSAQHAKLVDPRLIAMEKQGRHRYFRLADRDVA